MKELFQENKNYKLFASAVIGEAKASFHLSWHINLQRQFWSNQSKQQQVTNAFTKSWVAFTRSCEELQDKIAYLSTMPHSISGSLLPCCQLCISSERWPYLYSLSRTTDQKISCPSRASKLKIKKTWAHTKVLTTEVTLMLSHNKVLSYQYRRFHWSN